MKHLLIFTFITLISSGAWAQNQADQIQSLTERLEALEKRYQEQSESVVDELANIKTQMNVPGLEGKGFAGMGAGASKVYYSKSPLSIGGYGEVVYYDPRGGAPNTTDVYRLIPYIGYRFSDKIIFNSEIEFEHGDEVVVEFAYLDFLLHDALSIRAGNYLLPIGITNLKHEPVYFESVNRPDIERMIIPSTWHSNGVMLFGEPAEGFRYYLGTVEGLQAYNTETAKVEFQDDKSNSWIRGGRQKGAQALAEDRAYFAALAYENPMGVSAGGSYYIGDSAQDAQGIGAATVNLWEVHTEFSAMGFGAKALYVNGTLDNAEELTALATSTISSEVEGYYATLSYDLFYALGIPQQSLPIFVRYSEYDLNKGVPTGSVRDESLEKQVITYGVNYKPDPNVVIKANYVARDTKAGDEDDEFQLGLGFVF